MDKTKRKLSKLLGVAASGAVVWQKPIVNSVNLPAHAATSCSVNADCLGPTNIQPGPFWFSWPGGGGYGGFLTFYSDSNCNTQIGSSHVALASSEAEAQALFSANLVAQCGGLLCPAELILSVNGTCGFYRIPPPP